jgi:DNA-binding NarL/FixJ family response regulator
MQTVSVEQMRYKCRSRSVIQWLSMSSAHAAPESLPIHVVIVEDDPGFRAVLSRVVRAAPDMRLAGMVGTRAEGLAVLRDPPADVLLVDLGLPDGSGIDVIRAAALQWPSCSIMVSTNFGDETYVMRSIEAGAAGYLLKDSTPAKMIDEIRSLANGGSPISPIIARQVLARFRQSGSSSSLGSAEPRGHATDPSFLLSTREKEVLNLITKGFTTQEIATLMQLSPFTVRSFVRRIYSKLKVSSKAEAIYEARTLGLLAE